MEENIRLIQLVKDRPLLYDTNHADYTKTILKEDTWSEIAEKLNFPNGTAAKEQWRKLRDCHRDALRRQMKKINDGDSKIRTWIYQNQMAFLLPYMTTKFKSSEEIFKRNETLINYDEDLFLEEINHVEIKLEVNENCEDTGFDSSLNILTSKRKHFDDPEQSNMESNPKIIKTSDNEIEENEVKIEKDNKTWQTEQRPNETDVNHIVNETMYHFFMSMYNVTKNMPMLSQLKVRKNVFAATEILN
ncbi:uncharacterized protein LOC142329344 isoform X2 [Lycorma delicatula]|uniref:uncharacterized protein LOC142329344 isoform X2 n=1 Tax=Lycorma delicatula TaxID=130591 RepID=UPI003F51AAE7